MAFLGRFLSSFRAGDRKLAANDPAFASAQRLQVTSDAFADGAPMPPAYTGGKADFPPLKWSGVPPLTRSIALIVEDVDVPLPVPIAHAIAYGIDPSITSLPAQAIPRPGSGLPAPLILNLGRGIAGQNYAPPTPIPGHGPHHYVFSVFALDTIPRFESGPPQKSDLVAAMRGHVLALGSLIGTHEA